MSKTELITLLSLILILSGCQGDINLFQQKKAPEQIFTGFEGLRIEFLRNTPPLRVFEDSQFPVVLRVRNLGTHSLTKDSHGILALGLESDYNSAVKLEVSERVSKINELQSKFYLEGKSVANPKGDEEIISYILKSKKIDPQSEKRTSTLLATICYPYKTTLSTTVCIDTDIAGIKQTKKSCTISPIILSIGQGAPVAITKIDTIMVPAGSKQGIDLIKPEFIIQIENKGSGEVIKNNSVKEMCSQDINPEEKEQVYNTIYLKAYLSGIEQNNLLECSPKVSGINEEAYVKLIKKQDFVRCIVKDKNAISENIDAYSSPLNIIMEYGYTNTISSRYAIEKKSVS